MKRFPAESSAIEPGPFIRADVAGPPSPENPAAKPVKPAIVEMMPLVPTFRIELWLPSAMYKLEFRSSAIDCTKQRGAPVAGPPSPPEPQSPVPATVDMMPDPAEILRTTLLMLSAIYRLPPGS